MEEAQADGRSRHRGRWVAGGVVGAVVVVALVLFQPWQLVIDRHVDEAVPPGQVTLSSGAFEAHAHPTSGTALLVEADGRTYVRFEGLETDNGPDLLVYLTAESAGARQIGDEHVELGALKGNVGNQNYEVPAGVDLSTYTSIVIWCRRFSVSFGAAPVAVPT